MKALVILDKKNGHANISKGIVKAIKTQLNLQTTYLRLKPICIPFSKILTRIWPTGLNAANFIANHRRNTLIKPNLIIASGGNTLWLAAALARKYGAISIFCGSCRKLPVGTIDILLHYDQSIVAKEKGLYIPITLSHFSIKESKIRATKPNNSINKQSTGQFYACLIGGDGGGYKWRRSDYSRLAKILCKLSNEHNVKWFISGSRRTPKYVAKLFDSIINPEFIVDNCWYQLGDNREVLPQYIADSDFVLVTEDSASMLHESIGNCRPTCSISPRTSNPDQCLLNFLTVAESRCWLFRANVETFSTKGFFARIKCLRPLETSNNHFVGDIIVDKIQQLTSMR